MVIVIGGIYGGIFTPTEAAAVAAVYAFIAAKFFYRDLKWKQVPKTLLSAANTSAMLLYIITNAILFSFLMTSEQIPQDMSQWVLEQHLQPWMFLLMVNLALIAAGQFMEPTSIVLILAPLFLPIARTMGIDPIHLGIIMVVNMEIGMIHPPVGLNLFVSSHLAKDGSDRSLDRDAALGRRDADLPRADHLRPDHFHLAAASALQIARTSFRASAECPIWCGNKIPAILSYRPAVL